MEGHNENAKSGIRISKNRLAAYAVLLMAAVILVVSVVQAYQIAALNDGPVKASSGSGSSGASAVQQQGAGQAAAQQAPAMVGGC